jgi:hypothetical protein
MFCPIYSVDMFPHIGNRNGQQLDYMLTKRMVPVSILNEVNTISSVPIDVTFFGKNSESGENPERNRRCMRCMSALVDESRSLGNREGRVLDWRSLQKVRVRRPA